MQTAVATTTAVIRQLNDQFRQTLSGGRIVLTPGIMELDESTREELLRQIVHFHDFNAANDPHGEHDFVALAINGAHVFVKIDYYSLDLMAGSDDPSDPARTTRVMTIMTAEEY